VAIRLGTGADFAANKIMLGTTPITKVYLGTVQIWPAASTTAKWYRIGSMWYRIESGAGLTTELRTLTLLTNDIPDNILSYPSAAQTVASVLNRSLGV
jgi:hypothetical protein